MNKDEKQSYHLQLSWGFQDLIDSGIILRFCSIQSVGVENETPVTLVIDIFKLSTSRKVSLLGWPFGQKGFTQLAQLQFSPDAGDTPISMQVYQFWARQFQAPKLRTKSQPKRKSQFYHFKLILSCETSMKPWLLGLLPWTSRCQTHSNLRKIDLCGHHRPNYFARLVLEMSLFPKVCSRS